MNVRYFLNSFKMAFLFSLMPLGLVAALLCVVALISPETRLMILSRDISYYVSVAILFVLLVYVVYLGLDYTVASLSNKEIKDTLSEVTNCNVDINNLCAREIYKYFTFIYSKYSSKITIFVNDDNVFIGKSYNNDITFVFHDLNRDLKLIITILVKNLKEYIENNCGSFDYVVWYDFSNNKVAETEHFDKVFSVTYNYFDSKNKNNS